MAILTKERRARLRDRIRRELNRPEEDDLFQWPEEYDGALERAIQHYRRLTAQHYPDVLYQVDIITPDEDDEYAFEPPGDHLGEMELWMPPGPPRGRRILPGTPLHYEMRFYVQGGKLRLTRKRKFTPGLYMRWVPTEPDESTPPLPKYYDNAVVLKASELLASKPGFMGDPASYRHRSNMEWGGDPENPSDAGIIGTIERQSVDRGYENIGGDSPWWGRITSDV